MTKTLIFDIGGVLVDLDYDKLCQPLADLSNWDVLDVREEVERGSLVRSLMKGLIEPPEFHRALTDKLGIDLGFEQFCNIWVSMLSENQEIRLFVEQLEPGYALALASNTEPIHFAHCDVNYRVLSNFKVRFLSHEMGLLKPDQEFFRKLLRDLDGDSEGCVFIDDREENVESARAVGITAVQYRGVDELGGYLRSI